MLLAESSLTCHCFTAHLVQYKPNMTIFYVILSVNSNTIYGILNT
jgi:hypothetical protein